MTISEIISLIKSPKGCLLTLIAALIALIVAILLIFQSGLLPGPPTQPIPTPPPFEPIEPGIDKGSCLWPGELVPLYPGASPLKPTSFKTNPHANLEDEKITSCAYELGTGDSVEQVINWYKDNMPKEWILIEDFWKGKVHILSFQQCLNGGYLGAPINAKRSELLKPITYISLFFNQVKEPCGPLDKLRIER